jgi:C4-dicarboxylate transporter DctM subunit
MFLLMAQVISICEISDDFFNVMYNWLYWLPASLAACCTITAAGFAAISGSSTAATATIGSVSLSPMLKRKYNKKLICGVITSGGALGILIPPSLSFIVYGFVTETSIAKLFMAGILPGIVIAAFLILTSVIAATIKPSLAPKGEIPSWEKRWKSLPNAIPFLAMASLVSTFLYFGIATITEVAAAGAIGSLIIASIYRRLTFSKLKIALFRTVRTTGMIMLIVIGGMIFSFVLTSAGLPHRFAETISGLSINPWVIIISINILFLILGCLLDAICIIVLTMPFFFPILVKMGIDPIWFGVLVTINMEIGLLTPPVGLNLYVLRGIVSESEVSTYDIVMGSTYYLLILLLGLVLIMIFPQLALWLPQNVK